MEDNGLYNKFQSEFRNRRSCQDHIMRLADEVHKAINDRQFTLSLMIDLEKAFDLVRHKGLLYKIGSSVFTATCLVQRCPAVPNGNGKMLRIMGLQDLDQQDCRDPLLSKQIHPVI